MPIIRSSRLYSYLQHVVNNTLVSGGRRSGAGQLAAIAFNPNAQLGSGGTLLPSYRPAGNIVGALYHKL
jgi:hypothetical protein